jgi:hypothetical protein
MSESNGGERVTDYPALKRSWTKEVFDGRNEFKGDLESLSLAETNK